MGLARYWYNRAIEALQNEEKVPLASCLLKSLQQTEQNEWALDCPQRIRLWAVDDAINASKNAGSKGKKTGQWQRLRFRSRKNPKQGFKFDKVSLGDGVLFGGRKAHRIYFRAYEPVPKPDTEGCALVCENGRFYLTVPVRVPKRQIREPRQRACALDPGIRSFVTYYSEETHGSIGAGAFTRVVRLCHAMDDLISRMSKAKAKKRGRMKKALKRLRWKVKDLVDEIHKKVAHFLVARFDAIFLPTFETSEMAVKAKRKIRAKTVRSMLTFAFFRFRQTLVHMAERYGAEVRIVSEAYTSKTCSYCGNVQKIGGSKRFRCKNCQVDVDRDFNGARGIFLSCVAGSRLGQPA